MANFDLFYAAILNSLGGQFSTEVGSRAEAWVYATAKMLARARDKKEQAANQYDPTKVDDMLPVREDTYGLVPGRLATLAQRRAALAAKYLLPQGAKLTAANAALTAALGSDFLYYRTTKRSEIATFPASPGNSGIFQRALTPPKVIQMGSISVLNQAIHISYAPLVPHAGFELVPGEELLASVNNIGLCEKVTVLSATGSTFEAVFTKSHDTDDIGTTGHFPFWKSSQCHVTIIVTPAAAHDPEKKRKVHDIMAEMSRGWVTWDICPSTNGTSTDAARVGNATTGRIGYAGIGSTTFP